MYDIMNKTAQKMVKWQFLGFKSDLVQWLAYYHIVADDQISQEHQ